MNVRVVAFASAAEALGSRELRLELPEGATLATVGSRLRAERPGLEPLWSRLALAIDGEVQHDDASLAEGCEVALLPPVSGG